MKRQMTQSGWWALKRVSGGGSGGGSSAESSEEASSAASSLESSEPSSAESSEASSAASSAESSPESSEASSYQSSAASSAGSSAPSSAASSEQSSAPSSAQSSEQSSASSAPPLPAFIVSGAGTAAANGDYFFMGTTSSGPSAGVHYYAKADLSAFIFGLVYLGNTYWFMGPTLDMAYTNLWYSYNGFGSYGTPDSISWIANSAGSAPGTNPVPTVTAGGGPT